VDDGKLRSRFCLDEEVDPKEIVVTLDYNGPNGPPDPNPIIMCGFYRLAGDTLQMCFGLPNEFPENFSDEHGMVTLERDRGPIPESRKPSGTPALDDATLGRLVWDDNLNWYSGKFRCGELSVDVSLHRDDTGSVDAALARARDVVRSIHKYVQLAKTYAAEWLLDLKNDNWLDEDEEPLTPAAFMQRMSLESIVFGSGGKITFYHHDGDLFWGHCIQICIDAKDNCLGADIPG
jgi:hypothetical protein